MIKRNVRAAIQRIEAAIPDVEKIKRAIAVFAGKGMECRLWPRFSSVHQERVDFCNNCPMRLGRNKNPACGFSLHFQSSHKKWSDGELVLHTIELLSYMKARLGNDEISSKDY